MVRVVRWIGIPLLHVVPRGCLRYHWTYQGSSGAEVEEGKHWLRVCTGVALLLTMVISLLGDPCLHSLGT